MIFPLLQESGIPRVVVYLDDILVSGTSKEDHLKTLEIVLQRLLSADLSVKKRKMSVHQIEYKGGPLLWLCIIILAMYNYFILFKFSSTHANANALSRLPLLYTPSITPTPPKVTLLLEQMSESPVTVTQIHSWTQRDPILSQVVHFILSGWPREIKVNDTALKPFFNQKWELSTQDGVVLWGSRIIIPPPGCDYILEELHISHPGISHMHMKTLSRSFVWWPVLDEDIE